MKVLSLGVVCISLLVGGCASPAGPRACTEIGCTSGLHIAVSPKSAWPHGEYRFEIQADAETSICTGTLPLPPCGTPAMICDGVIATISESGCALPASQHAFADLHFPDTPARVQVEIFRDLESIVREVWTPQYETLQPNGPSCEPTCRSATLELSVPLAP